MEDIQEYFQMKEEQNNKKQSKDILGSSPNTSDGKSNKSALDGIHPRKTTLETIHSRIGFDQKSKPN